MPRGDRDTLARLRQRIQAVAARQVKPPHILTDDAQRVWLAGRDNGIAAVLAALTDHPTPPDGKAGEPDDA